MYFCAVSSKQCSQITLEADTSNLDQCVDEDSGEIEYHVLEKDSAYVMTITYEEIYYDGSDGDVPIVCGDVVGNFQIVDQPTDFQFLKDVGEVEIEGSITVEFKPGSFFCTICNRDFGEM